MVSSKLADALVVFNVVFTVELSILFTALRVLVPFLAVVMILSVKTVVVLISTVGDDVSMLISSSVFFIACSFVLLFLLFLPVVVTAGTVTLGSSFSIDDAVLLVFKLLALSVPFETSDVLDDAVDADDLFFDNLLRSVLARLFFGCVFDRDVNGIFILFFN
jgi:hypothetical protein